MRKHEWEWRSYVSFVWREYVIFEKMKTPKRNKIKITNGKKRRESKIS